LGTRGIINLLEQVVELFPVAQWQPYHQAQALLSWQASHRLQVEISHSSWHVTV
jgi:hypothetical protein